MRKWRLGVDLGTNSLGWAVIWLDENGIPRGLGNAGSRIFSDGRDPKSGASLAVDRRDARAMRRRRDRFQQLERALMTHLVADGLFPADPDERRKLEVLDPYELRARALDEALTLPELGRAIWHLNQRRGFKSNRKTDKPDKPGDESGKIKTGVSRLNMRMEMVGARTFGEWLHIRRQDKTLDHPDGLSVRTRLRPEQGEGAKGDGYDFYPGRDLLEEEFNEIWAAQAPHHPDALTPAVHDRLFEIVFHQRPLKQPKIGTCTFGSGEPRLAKAHPLFQRRRLLEEINALQIVRVGKDPERLTPEQRDLLLLKLKGSAKVSFASLRKVLKLEPEARFNKESENRTELKGDEVAAAMLSKTRLGGRWEHLSQDEQWDVIEKLETAESDADVKAFRAWVAERYGLSDNATKALSAARLPQGFGRFGETVTRALIDALTHGRTPEGRDPKASPTEPGRVIVYSEAVRLLGLHHSDLRDGVDHGGKLPYYGEALERHVMPGSGDASETDVIKRVGRLTNPTVHIGLNQLRRTVNKLIERYGPPAEIAIELARELKLTDDEKKKRNRENNENRLAAEKRSEKLQAIGQEDRGGNRALLKLWEELNPANVLDRRCVYTGRQISINMLFNGEAEVDHILPLSATLDDSNGNKIVCLQEVNRLKRKRSPYEASGDLERRYGPEASWDNISARASCLPRSKRWRFEPNAMDRAKEEGGFLARQLVDTQYLSRLAYQYLMALYPKPDDDEPRQGPNSPVWVSPGKLTAVFRHAWGLDTILTSHNQSGFKNRNDHRHHAVDAITIALTDRSMIKRAATIAGQHGPEEVQRLAKMIEKPWSTLRDDVEAIVNAITVSHRPDHGTAGHGLGSTAGRLHNDTAYGLTGEKDAKGNTIVVRRKPLAGLKVADIGCIRDPDLRAALYAHTEGLDGKALEQALATFPRLGPLQFRGVRRVRVTEPLSVIPIRDRQGKAFKAYKGDANYSYDVWELPNGKWQASVVSMFDAHQREAAARPHPAARKLLSLHQNDLVAIEKTPGDIALMRVVKFGQDGRLYMAEPNESGALKARDADKADPFRYTDAFPAKQKAWRLRKVSVDEIGRVRDPGFGARTAVRRTRPKLGPAV